VRGAWTFLRLYTLPVLQNKLPENARMVPAW